MSSQFTESADVWKNGVLAARLKLNDENTEFSYVDEYLSSGLPAVATSLPLSDEPVFTARRSVPPFFAGLLPEGRRLTALRIAKKISADDEFSILLNVGADPIGDVQVVETGHTPQTMRQTLENDSPLDFELLAAEAFNDSSAIPGVQDKVSGRMISLPVMKSNAEYILKLNPPEFPNVVENEHYFIELARSCRIPTVEAQLVHDDSGAAGLLVTRFDRVVTKTETIRLAAEDGCQIMRLWPGDKYSVTTEALFASVAAVCTSESLALRDMYRQWLFALITGNGDLHGKNFSVLWHDGLSGVSPAYDLPSTVFYGDFTLALPALGKRNGFSRRQVIEFAEQVGLADSLATRILDELLERTAHVVEDIGQGAIPIDANKQRTAVKQLRNRRKLLGA